MVEFNTLSTHGPMIIPAIKYPVTSGNLNFFAIEPNTIPKIKIEHITYNSNNLYSYTFFYW